MLPKSHLREDVWYSTNFKFCIMIYILNPSYTGRARNAEHYRLQEALLKAITAEFSTKYGISALREAYSNAFEKEDSIYLRGRSYAETKAMKAKDAERINLFRFVKKTIQSKKLSPVEAEVAAAEALTYVVKLYNPTVSKPYAENTAEVSDLVKKLQSSENSSYVETLGLTDAVATLKASNEGFDELYSHRADSKRIKSEKGDLRKARRNVDAALLDLLNAISAVYSVAVLVEKDETKEAEIVAVVNAVNAEIMQFLETLSRRGIGKKATASSSTSTGDITTTEDDAPVIDEGGTDESTGEGGGTGGEENVPELM